MGDKLSLFIFSWVKQTCCKVLWKGPGFNAGGLVLLVETVTKWPYFGSTFFEVKVNLNNNLCFATSWSLTTYLAKRKACSGRSKGNLVLIYAILQSKNLDSKESIIVGGDFNCPLNPALDKRGGLMIPRRAIVERQIKIEKIVFRLFIKVKSSQMREIRGKVTNGGLSGLVFKNQNSTSAVRRGLNFSRLQPDLNVFSVTHNGFFTGKIGGPWGIKFSLLLSCQDGF